MWGFLCENMSAEMDMDENAQECPEMACRRFPRHPIFELDHGVQANTPPCPPASQMDAPEVPPVFRKHGQRRLHAGRAALGHPCCATAQPPRSCA